MFGKIRVFCNLYSFKLKLFFCCIGLNTKLFNDCENVGEFYQISQGKKGKRRECH